MFFLPTETDITNIVEALDSPSFNGTEIMARCAFHDDRSPSMRFNTAKGVFICYSCGEKGGFRRLADQLGVTVRGQEGEESAEVTIQQILRILDHREEVKSDLVLPENYLEQFNNEHGYWAERGFSPATIKQFDLGYDFTADAVTIPVRNNKGELLGVTRRFLDPDAECRYKYFRGFNRSTNLFASWLVERDPEDMIVLTEGALDAVALWEAGYPALAQYGSSISAGQVKLLTRLGVNRVVLMFDNDKAGYRAKEICQGFDSGKAGRYNPDLDLTRRFEVCDILYPIDIKDPGDMTKEQIETAIANARWLNSWN